MTSPGAYFLPPGLDDPQVMSAQSTRVEANVSGQAAAVPSYGGVVSGGAGATSGGGLSVRDVIQESGLPNGTGIGVSRVDVRPQLPYRPTGRTDPPTMASAVGDAAGYGGQPEGAVTQRVDTGLGANSRPDLGATSRRLQGEGVRDQEVPSNPTHQTSQQPATHQTSQQPAAHQTSQQPAAHQTSQQPAAHQTSQQPAAHQTSQRPAVHQALTQPAQQPAEQQSAPSQRVLQRTSEQTPLLPLPGPSTRTTTISRSGQSLPQREGISADVIMEQARGSDLQGSTSEGVQQARAQLTEQRSALVTALHARASRMLNAGDGTPGVSTPGSGTSLVEHSGEQVIWFSRLRGFLQRTVEPVLERMRPLPAPSPASWYSQSPTWPGLPPADPPGPEQFGSQYMQDWGMTQGANQQPERAPSSNGSIPAEVVQEEVRKQVQRAMQARDNQVTDLQSENQELKRILVEMLEAGAGQGPGGVRGPVAEEVRGEHAVTSSSTTSAGAHRQGEPGMTLGPPGSGFGCGPPGLPEPLRAGPGLQPGGTEAMKSVPTATSVSFENGSQNDVAGKFQGAGETVTKATGGTLPTVTEERESTGSFDLLAQGIQQLQQLQLRRDGHDPELLKGSLELPRLPEPYLDTSAVSFLEWVYEAGQIVGSITDRASTWWALTLEAAMDAYCRFQEAAPLQRLNIKPETGKEGEDEKWGRLDKRVMALLLQAMTSGIKQEVLMLRLGTVREVLYKLYTVYAPGGAAERASLLKQLESIPQSSSAVEAIASLRRWKKLTVRATEMGVALPDGSILLLAVDTAIRQLLDAHKDVSFRLNLAKQELQLPHRPTMSSVMTYADHVLSELQQVIPYSKEVNPKLKGASTEPVSPASSATSPTGKGHGQRQPCKFWLTDEGCRRGSSCKYAHQFNNKEEKKARCWTCGAKTHRQADCPTKSNDRRTAKGAEKRTPGEHSSSSTTTNVPQVAALNPPTPSTASVVTPATTATSTLENPSASSATNTSSGSSSAASTVLFNEAQPNTGEIRELAEQFLAKIKRLAPLQAMTDNAVMDLELLLRSQGLGESHGMALLDSGASHPYRAPRTEEEARNSRRVKVQLADGKYVYLKQNDGGTLLAEDDNGGTILPLGSLVEALGCRLEWSRKRGLRILHPKYGLLPTKLVGNTPVLREAEALKLIADLEQAELEKLELKTAEGALRTLSVDEPVTTWIDHLEEFVNTGERAALRRMLLDEEAPLQAPLEQDITELIGIKDKLYLSDEAGALYLKSLPFNRATRKRLLRTRWVVHLFSGDESGEVFAQVESEDVTVVRFDIRISKALNVRAYTPAVQALMWAAARGQIEGIVGGPPRASESGSMPFRRMMLTWLVAHVGATSNSLCSPFFMMEAPTWHPVWTSFTWSRFKDEFRYLRYHAVATEQGVFFMASTLSISDGIVVTEAEIPRLNYPTPESTWPMNLQRGLAEAMVQWRRSDLRRYEAVMCKMVSRKEMNAKDLAYWESHVANGHVPYDRRCRTCARAAATGRAHRRCVAPSAYTLGLDIAGPFRSKGVSASEKGLRYILVGAYSHPKLDIYKEADLPGPEDDVDLEPEMDPFEEEPRETEHPDEEDDEEQKAMNERFQALYKDIGDDLEYQTLHFAVPMRTRTSKEVRARIQQIYLQLRQHGLPLVRIHSDRGRELMVPETRTWMADRDILATTGESQQPQQDGRAESLVRTIKTRIKVLLRTAGLPMTCWPLAAEFSARRQRDLALGDKTDERIPFGAPVHVKHKRFGEGGKYDLAERWRSGSFVGYSGDVRGGRVVRHDDGTFTTSVHIKPYLIDSDDLVQHGPFEMEVEDPVRRVRGKSRIAQMTLNPDNAVDRKARDLMEAERYSLGDLVELWEVLRDRAKPTTRTTQGQGLQWLVGQYTHGGQCGVTLDSDKYPVATTYIVQAYKELTGFQDFTSLLITDNVGMSIHRDVHNCAGRDNVLLPLLPCDEGGGVWMECEPMDYDITNEWRQLPKGDWRRGRVEELQPGVPIRINPRMFHETEPWVGRRLVITAYTPRTTKMKQPTFDHLKDLGFNPPPLPPQVPEALQRTFLKMMNITEDKTQPDAVMFLLSEAQEERREKTQEISQELQELQDDVLERLRERRQWLMEFLAEEEILAEELDGVREAIREEVQIVNEAVQDLIKEVEGQVHDVETKCQNLYIKVANAIGDKEIGDVEEYLANLKKDLDITLDVPLDQVRANLEKWVEPMNSELSNLEVKTDAIEQKPIEEARKMANEGKLILIPGKVVFTVKPPPPVEGNPGGDRPPRWKRKARIVICGNMASQVHNTQDLYAAGASVEALRLALALAAAMGWEAGATDVLVQAKLVPSDVVFVVRRALYGLRESPALWANHRTRVLRELSVETPEGKIWLKPLITDGELWMILRLPPGAEQPLLQGLLVTYVDDLLYLAKREIIRQLHAKISSIWPCSALEFSEKGLRYLGMELQQDGAAFTLGQEAYVANLVRIHGLSTEDKSVLPCPREWVQDEDQETEPEASSPEDVVKAQKITGECLWLACRTRPDILYVTNHMAALSTRRPARVCALGLRVVGYLNSTSNLKLRVEAQAEPTQSQAEPTQSQAEPTQSQAEPMQSQAEPMQSQAEPMQSQAEPLQSSSSTLLPQSRQHQAGFRVELSGYSDASFAPFGTKSFGCSLVMVGRTPVFWKAGKQSMVAMSVCEAELMEGSTCALLLESTQAMLEEILPDGRPPTLYIDNMAANNILNGSMGSWRTRHLRIRHSYVLDRVAKGQLTVRHLAGEDQPADLPTKLHSRARLLRLLGVWNMVGLPGLTGQQTIKFLKLGCLFLLMMAVQSLAAAAEKDPLPMTGTSELLLLLVITCVGAVVIWEAVKASGKWMAQRLLESKKTKRLRRLRELARVAAEAEIEKWMDAGSVVPEATVEQTIQEVVKSTRRVARAATSESSGGPSTPLASPRPTLAGHSPESGMTIFGTTRSCRPPTPPIPRGRSTSPVSQQRAVLGERERVVHDCLGLLTVQALKDGLTHEGLMVSGVKSDLLRRLAPRLDLSEPPASERPTTKQLRYVLYAWRHRRLAGRTILLWSHLATRSAVSSWLHEWKDG